MAGASLPDVVHRAGEGALRAPFEPPASRRPAGPAGGGLPPFPRAGARMAERRTVFVAARVSLAERADWLANAKAADVPLSDLLRQAMARTRTWTAPAVAVKRERTVQVARIGNNLNQLARWANTYAERAEAVEIIAHLVAIERAIAELARLRREEPDAR